MNRSNDRIDALPDFSDSTRVSHGPEPARSVFKTGDRVTTPLGDGTVVYRRMRAPTYVHADVYSVHLDAWRAESVCASRSTYTGTIFKAEHVEALTTLA
jgi:hypothetical protein